MQPLGSAFQADIASWEQVERAARNRGNAAERHNRCSRSICGDRFYRLSNTALEHRKSTKTQLALALAQGTIAANWTRTNEVSKMTAVSKYAGLKVRMTDIEARLDERAGNASHAGSLAYR
jgi:hypothetical protein